METMTRQQRYNQYRTAARESFQKATICAVGVVASIPFTAAAVMLLQPAIAIGCACAGVICAFGFAVNHRDYRENERNAWLTRPRSEDYEL